MILQAVQIASTLQPCERQINKILRRVLPSNQGWPAHLRAQAAGSVLALTDGPGMGQRDQFLKVMTLPSGGSVRLGRRSSHQSRTQPTPQPELWRPQSNEPSRPRWVFLASSWTCRLSTIPCTVTSTWACSWLDSIPWLIAISRTPAKFSLSNIPNGYRIGSSINVFPSPSPQLRAPMLPWGTNPEDYRVERQIS